MNFYRRRPVVFILSLCALLYATAAFISGMAKIIIAAAITAFSLVLLIVSLRKKKLRIFGLPSSIFSVILMISVIGTTVVTYTFYDIHESFFRNLGEDSEIKHISAEIISVESDKSYSATYKIRLKSIDGVEKSATGLVYTETSPSLWVGCVIEFNAEFCLSEDFYSRDNARTALLSDGCVFTCTMTDTAVLVGESNSIWIKLTTLREALSAKMSLYLEPESAALSSALLLDDRGSLGKIYRDFSYIGVIHILALSGMHIVIIGGLFEKLLKPFKLERWIRRGLIAFFIISYVLVTGCSPSVVRAAIMLFIMYASGGVRKNYDRITSLFLSCALIVFVNPPSIYDAGLQLSFFATLGVLLLSEATSQRLRPSKAKDGIADEIVRFGRKTLIDIVASFGAVMFVIPIQWLCFGEMSLFSVPATLILSPILNLLLTVLLPYLLFAVLGATQICSVFAVIIELICSLCEVIAAALAEISPVISLKYPFVPPLLIGFFAVIAVMMAKNVRGWYKSLIPFFTVMALIFGGSKLYEISPAGTPTVNYTAIKSNDVFLLSSRGSSFVIDCTDGSGYAMGELINMMSENYSTHIDKFLFTRISSRHVSSLRILISRKIINQIFVPAPKDEKESHIIKDLYTIAEEYGTEIILYDRGCDVNIELGKANIELIKAVNVKRSVRPLSMIKFSANSSAVLYAGMSSWESEYAQSFVSDCDFIIFGVNGPSFKEYDGTFISEHTKHVYTPSAPLALELTEFAYKYGVPLTLSDKVSIVLK